MRRDDDREAIDAIALLQRAAIELGVDEAAVREAHEQRDAAGAVHADGREPLLTRVLDLVELDDDADAEPAGDEGQDEVRVQDRGGPPLKHEHVGAFPSQQAQRANEARAPVPVDAVHDGR